MTKAWFKAAFVRAIKTIAQAALAIIGTSAVITDVNWALVISASSLAGVISILTSLAGLPEVSIPKYKEAETRINIEARED